MRYDWGLDELYVTAWQDDEIKVKTTVYRAEEDLVDFTIKGYDEQPALLDDLGESQDAGAVIVTCLVEVCG